MKRRLWFVWVGCFFLSNTIALPDTGTKKTLSKPRSSSRVKIKLSKEQLKPALGRAKSKSNPDDSPVPVSVQDILVPRTINIPLLIRLGCILSMLVSLLQCVQTAGIPHVQTVWQLLHGGETTIMPTNYRPSTFDVHLAQILASSANELLPSIGLPSAGPLLGVLASILVMVGTTILLPRWFLFVKVFLEYEKIESNSLSENQKPVSLLVHIDDKNLQHSLATAEDDSCRSTVLCELHSSDTKKKKKTRDNKGDSIMNLQYSHPYPHYFEMNQGRFYFDATSGTCVNGGPLLPPIKELKTLVTTGGLSKLQRRLAEERYKPYNRPHLASPTIQEAFLARISTPLVVVQILGRLLSCLEEGPRSFLINTAFTLGQHYKNARQAILSARQMAQEVQASVQDMSSLEVVILKRGKRKQTWTKSSAVELLPGDIFVMSQTADGDLVIPVDALLLDGQGLINEAVLTGESVPQSKVPIDFDDEDALLDMHAHRNSILFAGTSMVHCTSPPSSASINASRVHGLPAHNETSAVTCMALRTGTYSSKGQLLRALKSSTHVGAISNAQSEKDAMKLIASLSVFAVASCVSLFLPSEHQKPMPAFRRVVQCTRIAIASIPSDLPLALSSVARSCSKMLRDDSDVSCSEPGSLLTAAYVDTVVFDKTGTLTADTQSLSKLISKLPNSKSKTSPSLQRFVLAGCHSLVQLKMAVSGRSGDSTVVGDPLDLAALQFSGWKYNHTEDCYDRMNSNSIKSKSDPIRLWQIKTFPFDPNRRLSSALVLSQSKGNKYSLWSLTKGSPESMSPLYNDSVDEEFDKAYIRRTQELEAQGYRSIALGAQDLSNSSHLVDDIFPNGLSGDDEAIQYARAAGTSLHRRDFEAQRDNVTLGLEFCGFGCFDAAIRPSSKRVIDELRRGGIKTTMLTGDAIDAALAVAWNVGLMNKREVAVLETEGSADGTEGLKWRIVKRKPGKDASFKTLHELARTEGVTLASVKDVLKRQQQGACSIAATGRALELVLGENADPVKQIIADNLFRLSVIARATPSLKKSVVTCFKDRCGQTVLMCGDGVNDVAAMKAADVAVALLNGFGAEDDSQNQQDVDDERRKKKIASKKIGSNRSVMSASSSPNKHEAQERIGVQIEKAHTEIKQRAAARQGLDPTSRELQLGVNDVKDMVAATMQAVKEEGKRAKSLKMGAGDAARILAEERRAGNSTSGDEDEDKTATTIKPGEASLVAAFSCLHPSIDGVDSILRTGIATAACALATQEMIALHSLMSCYHLASLYRDGFRYGKNMWPVELFLYLLVDSARFSTSCTPRPRLPTSRSCRPSKSMFHPSCIFSTLAQAAIHLASMAVGVNYGRQLERADNVAKRPSLINLSKGSQANKLSKLLGALVERGPPGENDGEPESASLFRRPPFVPNCETNIVFIFSVLQSAVSSVVNHRGKPFYRSILESRELCWFSGLTALFSVACIMESFPVMNGLLELRVLPSRKSKLVILGLATTNVLACIICRMLSELPLERLREKDEVNLSKTKTAADLEVELLKEESEKNLRGVILVSGVITYLVVGSLAKP